MDWLFCLYWNYNNRNRNMQALLFIPFIGTDVLHSCQSNGRIAHGGTYEQ